MHKTLLLLSHLTLTTQIYAHNLYKFLQKKKKVNLRIQYINHSIVKGSINYVRYYTASCARSSQTQCQQVNGKNVLSTRYQHLRKII